MATRRADDDPLFATTWVHVFEEDTDEGAVYRPDNHPMPLSRRSRERLELDRDGTAHVFEGGPDDRFVKRGATWSQEGSVIIVRTDQGGRELRLVDWTPARLVVQAPAPQPDR